MKKPEYKIGDKVQITSLEALNSRCSFLSDYFDLEQSYEIIELNHPEVENEIRLRIVDKNVVVKEWYVPRNAIALTSSKPARPERIDPLNLRKSGVPNVCFSLVDETYTKAEQKKYRNQRLKLGFDQTEIWNLYESIAQFIYPRLLVLKKLKHGYPGSLESPEAWDEILDKIIWSFEQARNDDWEDQYSSGESDILLEPVAGTTLMELKRGPKDTYKLDTEGLKTHRERIQ